ncbi:hypothetical protein PHMEG_00022844 [Phytophthora megakarya]|uniref:BED-type domain-containing protein n=1 Tax=Phytophthora megakarya TaxID=4795 RepID=A0A225VHN9_9STRA|nr:hypothetical protein PHMEG_00022844 [Phytophthora megakarya]
MVLTSSQICNMLFTAVGGCVYKRTSCEKQYKKGNGYTNLLNHLKRNHDNYEHEAQEAAHRQNPLHLHLILSRTRDLYRRIEWVVCDRLPLGFVERQLTRQNASLSLVRVTSELPDLFGLILDGWTNSSRHYLDIFAVFDGSIDGVVTNGRGSENDYDDDLDCSSRRFILLTFYPVDDEEDISAQSQFDLIADTLSRYDKPWSTVKFMVGDNCSVNQYIGRKEGAIPLIGCASHRFNLDVKDFLKTEEVLIAKVPALMTKLRTLKGQAVLRRFSQLTPLPRNDTRWSSTYEMVARYIVLQPCIVQLGRELLVEHEIHPLLLSLAEHERIKALMKHLERFEGVTEALQRTSLTLSAVRRLFGQVVKEYPVLKASLVPTAAIVNNPHLEEGLVKLQRGEALLALRSRHVPNLGRFRLKETPAREDTSNSIVKAAFKKRGVSKCSNYTDVSYVPPTSNKCERFFSATKQVLSDLRMSLSPNKLAMLMLLQYNRKMWDVHMVEELRARIGSNNAE